MTGDAMATFVPQERMPVRPATASPRCRESLVDLLRDCVETAGARSALVDGLAPGANPDRRGCPGRWAWTWAELAAEALAVADSLEAAGLRPGDRVAHRGPHGPDWIVVDLACLLAGVVHVALHDEVGDRGSLDWLGLRGAIVSGGAGRLAGLDGPCVEMTAGAIDAACRDRPIDRQALLDALGQRARACDPDAPCTIVLSSGTTGTPHGVLHSQRTLAANALAVADVFLEDPRDVRLAWLPMSHALARTGDLYTALVRGGCLNVVRDRTRVLDACAALPPTVVLGVPAFFERLEAGARAGRIADLRAALGGQVRVCVSGGAALRRRTAECFAAAGVPLVEGYGLAEAGPVVTLSNPRIARPGTVGPPLAGVELRIDAEADGEVFVRTPSRALGIVRPPADDAARSAAAAALESVPEWLPTGDRGAIDAAGHLRITGRLSERLVLSTGLKVPPAEVERALAEDPAVAQVCVVGDGLRWPVALVVPEPGMVRGLVRRLRLAVFSRRAALRHPRIVAWMARRIARRQRRLPAAWRVRRVVLVGRPFDAARGEATPSFKLKRAAIAAHFAAPIAAAGAARPPRWAGTVPTEPTTDDDAGRRDMTQRSWLTGCLWTGGRTEHAAGFAAAAAAAAMPVGSAVADVVARTTETLVRLRAEGRLYDAVEGASPLPRPPLADAPEPPAGRFSVAAEEALGHAGLWGLVVPPRFGGAGASLVELVRAITHVAADCPTAAGMLAVHSSIGAVAALTAFGSESQQARHLPGLAAGRPLSIFGGTEPEVGCDLAAVRAVLEPQADGFVLTGTKMFITGAAHGRLVKLLARLDGRPTVAVVRLPAANGPTFRLRHYALHPLKHAHNAALEFERFPVGASDLLAAPAGRDGMAIVWHGLNRGRVTLAAQAAGTLRCLLRHARDHARRRTTWGRPIADRELVQGRLARIAAGVVACDAMAAWAAAAIDAGQTGELEAIAAKIVASTCVREGAIDALGVHGGRAFLVGHPLGDSFHDHFAVTVYEGESDLLGLALFKGLAKAHPLAAAADASGLRRAVDWLTWRASRLAGGRLAEDDAIADPRLRAHAAHARRRLAAAATRIDRAIRRHGRHLAERQLEVAALAAEVRELVSVLAVAHHAALADARTGVAADGWCRLATARAGGGRLTAADHAALATLGRLVAE
jgi:long-subunit acyl-CoA synthetase (AMP-forming)/alkylation response protein AidB-like acyl-CoA dehydrogenase